METIATQVHNKIAQKLIETSFMENDFLLSKEKEELYSSIFQFGGHQVENVKEVLSLKEKDKIKESRNTLRHKIAELKLDPRWKIITYGSLMGILKEYNLVLGPLQNYIKEIPEKNANDMVEYARCERTAFVPYGGNPLFNFKSSHLYYSQSNSLKFFVCASTDNFEKNYIRIGEEIFYDADLPPVKFTFAEPNPDPIIVSPLIFEINEQKVLLIDHVTSWDREAGLIVNETQN